MYYLQSRYYDAEFSRFISCDKFVCANDDHSAYNLYSYCGNCPADRCDCIGFFWKKIWNGVKKAVRKVLNKTNKILVSIGLDTAEIGAYFLNMYKDSAGIYHAKFDCWQQYFGYNDFYDFMFDIGTSMKNKSFKFYWKGMWYILWAWKGNYINLGAGAEMGIYYDRNGGPCWKVDKKLRQNMTLTLFKGSSRVFSYSADTWWITGFNPNPKYFDVKENQLKASYSVHFKDEDMFKAFKKSNHQGWKYDAKKPIAKYSF